MKAFIKLFNQQIYRHWFIYVRFSFILKQFCLSNYLCSPRRLPITSFIWVSCKTRNCIFAFSSSGYLETRNWSPLYVICLLVIVWNTKMYSRFFLVIVRITKMYLLLCYFSYNYRAKHECVSLSVSFQETRTFHARLHMQLTIQKPFAKFTAAVVELFFLIYGLKPTSPRSP